MASPTVEIVTYRDSHFDGVAALWREAFPDDPPWNRAEVAIPAKLTVRPELFLVAVRDDQVIGSAMAAYDGHRGWLYAVAVLQSHRRQGVGRALVQEAERRLTALGCAKINLQIRASNPGVAVFYARLGYLIEDRVSMSKPV
jgi:ribosomal protein S18 acetylase RimI-like enzyme